MVKVDHKGKAFLTAGSPVTAMRCIRRDWTGNKRTKRTSPSARYVGFHAIPWPSNEADMLHTSLSSPGILLWPIPATVESMEDKRSREVWLNLEVWIWIWKSEPQSQTFTCKHQTHGVPIFRDTECQKVPAEVFVGCKFLAITALILALKFKIASWLW